MNLLWNICEVNKHYYTNIFVALSLLIGGATYGKYYRRKGNLEKPQSGDEVPAAAEDVAKTTEKMAAIVTQIKDIEDKLDSLSKNSPEGRTMLTFGLWLKPATDTSTKMMNRPGSLKDNFKHSRVMVNKDLQSVMDKCARLEETV